MPLYSFEMLSDRATSMLRCLAWRKFPAPALSTSQVPDWRASTTLVQLNSEIAD